MKIYLGFVILLFLIASCHEESGDDLGEMPHAAFVYSVLHEPEGRVLVLENRSVNADSVRWILNGEYVFVKPYVKLLVKSLDRVSLVLIATNHAGSNRVVKEIVLNAQFDMVSGSSYSWWCDPISFHYQGINYFSGVDELGQQVVYFYNNDKQLMNHHVVCTGYGRDEHNTAAILPVGQSILIAATGHNEDDVVHFSRYSLDFSRNDFVDIQLKFPVKTAYSILQQCGQRIFYATRAKSEWFFTWSDDGGLSWQPPKQFVLGNSAISSLFYIRMISVQDDVLEVTAYFHPVDAKDQQLLAWCRIMTNTGDVVVEDGRRIGNIYDPNFGGISVSDMIGILRPEKGHTFRFLDVAKKQHIDQSVFLIAKAPLEDYASGNYYYLVRDHLSMNTHEIEITAHGNTLPHPTYWGGAYFVSDRRYFWNGNYIFLSREQESFWQVEQYRFNGMSFTADRVLERCSGSQGLVLARPLPPLGSGEGGLSVIYQRGSYYGLPYSFNNWRDMHWPMYDANLMPVFTTGIEEEISEIF